MNKDEIEFTKAWWERTVNDPAKLTKWLQKLQRTELSGYHDHVVFMAQNEVSDRERLILTNIANDEFKHSDLLIELFESRKIPVNPESDPSTYWDDVLSNVSSTAEYCAANYFGEALASYRFEIILGMPQTPSDIREVIGKVLPDEIFHRETLMRLAGEEAIEKIKVFHENAYKKLTRK